MKKNMILLIVSFAMFMESVDTTIINTAIPVMAKSLNVYPIDLKLALISYLLSLAIFIPISGWVADKYGVKRVFISAVIVFTLSSIWCGYTDSLWELILARITQGIGGSLTMPVGRLIILRTCERHELISKMSIVVMLAAVGMMIGPLLGGLIVENFSWRWIFWVNIPIGLICILLSLTLLPHMPPRPVPPLDKSGFVLFGSGLAVLTFGLSRFSETDVALVESFLTIMLSVLLLFWYAHRSKNKEHPVVKISLLEIRTFRISVIANLFARISFGGIPFLLPLLFQIILGFSPRLSGLLIAPIALGVLLVKPLAVHILRFFGYKKLLLLNTLLLGLSLWSFVLISNASSVYEMGFLTFIYGFLIALQYSGMNSMAYANIKDNDISSVTSIMSTIQQIAQSFGVAIAAILITIFNYEFSEGSILTVKIFDLTFFTLGLLTLFSGLIFLNLKNNDGIELIEARPLKDPISP